MAEAWRYLDTGRLSASDNIALDQVLLRSRAAGGPSTVRVLQFSRECCLVGYHQAVELEIEEGFCARHGIAVCRRITGGGAIYLDRSQIGWEVLAGKEDPGIPSSIQGIYDLFGGAVAAALNDWGVPARFRRVNDLEVLGKKIGGTGGTSEGGAFLFQGTLLVETDVDRMMRCLRVPAAKLRAKGLLDVRDRLTSLRWELGRRPPVPAIKRKVAARLAEAGGAPLRSGGLTQRERSEFRRVRRSFRGSPWIHRIRLPRSRRSFREANHKADGGMVRVHLRLDPAAGRISEVVLTGDFFATPGRAVPDLEAALKDVPATPERIRGAVRAFWEAARPDIPGVRPDDISTTVLAAVRRGRPARRPPGAALRSQRR